MSNHVRYPSLYQVNVRVWLRELSSVLGRRATLDDVPDKSLDEFAAMGFDWIWLLSVWQTGPAAQLASRTRPEWRREFEETLPDLTDDDIGGSGFAIQSYTVHRDLGGPEALARLRGRMKQRGLNLMLDFVPNHMAPDHAWVDEHPQFFVHGSEQDLARSPQNFFRVNGTQGDLILAHGRDPYFDGWSDTVQLNYGHPQLQEAMAGELRSIADQCDGLRCDMAMLILPDVFQRTWGISCEPFWPSAIATVRQAHPAFLMMAEVYWDMEWELQQQGFDFAYDKRLYDRLRDGVAGPVRAHFLASLDYQNQLARFLENHDEARAAAAFSPAMHQSAAVVTFLSPGLRFFHQGQLDGRLKRISPHLVRGPVEQINPMLQDFYHRLLAVLRRDVMQSGSWKLLECTAAWEVNGSWKNFIAFEWRDEESERLLIVVNYSPETSQCYLPLTMAESGPETWRLSDLLNNTVYDRDAADLGSRGLYLDMKGWQYHAFEITAKP